MRILVMPAFAVEDINKRTDTVSNQVVFITIAATEKEHINFKPSIIESAGAYLKLTFDDISKEDDIISKEYIYFSIDMAKEIVEFVNKNKHLQSWILNCAAGISRSGAVGLWLAYYLNYDIDKFRKDNPYIHPNPLVLSLLEQVAPSGRIPTEKTSLFS